MRTKAILVVVVAVLFIGSPSVYADLVTIEADNFPVGTNVSNAFDYITLSASDGTSIYSVASTNVSGKLGANVLGFGLDEHWRDGPWNDYDYRGEYLIIEIDGFATRVSARIAAPNWSTMDNWVMTLGFDSEGVLKSAPNIGKVGWWDEWKGTSATGSALTRVTMGLIYGHAASIDHIVIDYTPIPEPATLLLLGLGAVMLRRRK